MSPKRFAVAASVLLVFLLGGTVACDYLLLGTYTGLCDEPKKINSDLGEATKLRMSQCQVMSNVCCRHRDESPTQMSIAFTKDLRTFCLLPGDCYLVEYNKNCYGDVDCLPGLSCIGGVLPTTLGTCGCPDQGVYCAPPMPGTSGYCCSTGMTCGQGSCQPPAPPDMTASPPPPDLHTPEGDMARRLYDGSP